MNDLTNWEDNIRMVARTSKVTRSGLEVVFDPDSLITQVRSLLEQAKLEGRREMLEKVIETVKEKDYLVAVKDNDFHRYQIPSSKLEEWDTFLNIDPDDEASWDVPEWAERIDGHPASSFKDSLLTTLDQLGDK